MSIEANTFVNLGKNICQFEKINCSGRGVGHSGKYALAFSWAAQLIEPFLSYIAPSPFPHCSFLCFTQSFLFTNLSFCVSSFLKVFRCFSKHKYLHINYIFAPFKFSFNWYIQAYIAYDKKVRILLQICIVDSASAEYCSTFTCMCVRPWTGVTSHLFIFITCIRPCKPYIFWKLMTATIHWPLGDHLVTTWWQLGDHLVTTWWLLRDHLAHKLQYERRRIRTVYSILLMLILIFAKYQMSTVSPATKCTTLQSPPPTIYWTSSSSTLKVPLQERSHLRIIHSESLHFMLMEIVKN